MALTNQARAEAYAQAFPHFPRLRADDRWIDGSWVLGNDYRGSGYYGAYPPAYLKRAMALFPDATRLLHVCSGSLQRPPDWHGRRWVSIDLQRSDRVRPTVCGDACRLPFASGSFDLALVDPPYTKDDATRYGTALPNRRKMLSELHRVIEPGGTVMWLDCTMPMFRRQDFEWYIAIGVFRSTNHRFRGAVGFRRVDTHENGHRAEAHGAGSDGDDLRRGDAERDARDADEKSA